jgi:hypothetical protein
VRAKRPIGTTKPWHRFPGPDAEARSRNAMLDMAMARMTLGLVVNSASKRGMRRRMVLKAAGPIYGRPQRERV